MNPYVPYVASATTTAVFLVVWLGCGLSIVLTMRRLGHRLALWLPITLAGPLASLFALSERSAELEARPERLAGPTDGPGDLDVLVGLDDSEHAREALTGALTLFGDRIRRLHLATAVDFETALYPDTSDRPRDRARAILTDAAEVAERQGHRPGQEILAGDPATALREEASRLGVDLVVVGTRGRGASHLLGSTASHLAAGAGVPLLLIGDGHRPA